MNEKIFREYDIRGIADKDLTDSTVDSIAGSLGYLFTERGVKKISIGRDCRESSPRIHSHLVEGILKSGIEVVDIGLVPTPLLYFSTFHLKLAGGIMITGSHNPPDQNGFKVCLGKGTLHGEDIQLVKKFALNGQVHKGTGNMSTANVLPAYLETVLKSIPPKLQGIIVAVDSGNGMGGIVAPLLYRKLGCEVIELHSQPDRKFPNHHPDPTLPENLKDLIEAVKKSNAQVGIAFDGDADRIGVVGPTGRIFFGDELLALYSRQILRHHPGATIISEVKASHRFYQDVEKHGGEAIMWKTGHSLIKAKMQETGALLAGEMSGHMFFNDRYFGYDDAVYAGARLLEILSQEKKSPEELLADLPPSVSTPEIRVDCSDETKFQVVEEARKKLISMGLKVISIDGARVEFEDGWGLVRASNTQAVLVFRFEASDEKRLKEIRDLLENTVKQVIKSATPDKN